MSQFDEFTLHEPDPSPTDPHAHSHTQSIDPLARRRTFISSVTDRNPFDSQSYDSDWFSDLGSASDRDVGRFLNDLFERRSDDGYDLHAFDVPGSGSDPFSEFEFEFANGGEFGSDQEELPGIGFGFEIEFDAQYSAGDGLRVAGLDSESDPSVEFNSEDSNFRLENFCLEEQRTGLEGFEWEEVEEGVFNQRENLGIMVEGVEELSVGSSEEVGVRNLEWEILLGANMRLERAFDADSDSDSYLAAFQDEYDAEPAEYDTIFGRFGDNGRGSPPAAKRVVENLPFVELTVEELQTNALVCAVCKDAIVVEEKVRRLPCSHYYHGDCIVPWLSIRNTCPVCRYELPTEDTE
ncbi:hypothetical protein I3843_03G075600 [Carya illinoinensis]|uniref:RING-type E3 ubiquitin transferase n=1 Tax=Carya illinoinensis TaxID=32201 RepID=A0A8T1QY85_CARIL|nr:E3 ubiquitin-protein ligase CIP8 [Carya illinoinensis]XP_042970431.1 E3 ubiquitin-protein ligase CIP8 [Carya illinoinensis]XP_042970432.1 E3 ubiquitin-protein ligase CIP8 [Carya illinoinensis]KAG2715365.1 hypothetical protein I3760_03G073000 [Carya illinoinensis]KAG2715366.1 hypothetical protein I3760_03G073000 [Carya illinoinensis]KAG2715367.1 hypothetical protein I3760_03G073000 [Carya illinoinensis]KAG2715368.1 hypothetical protein I3760_03G073000 [Carya illinoinensis]KAG6660080.1 hypo